jgi:hypothetical protein
MSDTTTTHRCHLEKSADRTRTVCACGWAGRWYVLGARAVEQGIAHCIAAQRHP